MSIKNRPTRPLLTQIGGRPVQQYEPPEVSQPLVPLKMNRVVKVEEYDPITAPPESSDDEETAQPPVGPIKEPVSDSDEDEPPRGDIKPTLFGKENRPLASRASSSRKSTRNAAKSLEHDSFAASGSQSEGPSSSAGSKRQLDEHGDRAGGHLVDEYGFTKPKKLKKANKMRIPGKNIPKNQGYGKPRSYHKPAPRSSAHQRDG